MLEKAETHPTKSSRTNAKQNILKIGMTATPLNNGTLSSDAHQSHCQKQALMRAVPATLQHELIPSQPIVEHSNSTNATWVLCQSMYPIEGPFEDKSIQRLVEHMGEVLKKSSRIQKEAEIMLQQSQYAIHHACVE